MRHSNARRHKVKSRCTSAPVTSMDRHANTRRERKGRKRGEGGGSTSAPVTSMDRHASTRGPGGERGTETDNETKKGRGVRVHLSRLWTDTQVRKEKEGGRDDRVAQLSKLSKILGDN